MQLPLGYEEKFTVKPKVEYEFQAVCLDLEKFYGKQVWTLPYKVGFTERKIVKAHEICVRRGKISLGYLIGVIKRLKPDEY